MNTIDCTECGDVIQGETFRDEYGVYTDYPDTCPHCGEPLYTEQNAKHGYAKPNLMKLSFCFPVFSLLMVACSSPGPATSVSIPSYVAPASEAEVSRTITFDPSLSQDEISATNEALADIASATQNSPKPFSYTIADVFNANDSTAILVEHTKEANLGTDVDDPSVEAIAEAGFIANARVVVLTDYDTTHVVRIRQLVTHELFHCVGLAHETDKPAIMAPAFSSGNDSATITAADTAQYNRVNP